MLLASKAWDDEDDEDASAVAGADGKSSSMMTALGQPRVTRVGSLLLALIACAAPAVPRVVASGLRFILSAEETGGWKKFLRKKEDTTFPLGSYSPLPNFRV